MSISVVMCAYNVRDYIESAIDSVLAQTYRAFEFIIIDDGSTDGTSEVIDSKAGSDQRIKVIRNRENKGMATGMTTTMPTASLNQAIGSARYELIARFDSDDIMLPTRLERQRTFMAENPDVSVAASFSYLVDKNGATIGRTMPVVDVEQGKALCQPSLFVDIVHPTVMFRRNDFLSVGAYRPVYLEDRDLWGRFVTSGYKIAVQREFLILNRRHANNVSFEKHLLGWHYGGFIDENIRRRLRGLPELTFKEYQNSHGFLWRLNDDRKRLSQLHFRKAVLAYASKSWWPLSCSLALAVALDPTHIPRRIARKIASGVALEPMEPRDRTTSRQKC